MSDRMHAAPKDGREIEALWGTVWFTTAWSDVKGRWIIPGRWTKDEPQPTGWRYSGTEFDRGRERMYHAYCGHGMCGSDITGRALDGKFLGWWHSMDIIDQDHDAIPPQSDIEEWSDEASAARLKKLQEVAEQPRVPTREEKLQAAVDALLEVHNSDGRRWVGFPRAEEQVSYCTNCQERSPCTTVETIREALQ